MAGKPLIAWTIEEVKKSVYIDRAIISTEDEEIKDIATQYGGDIPFLRPVELAQDHSTATEVVLDVLKNIGEYDYVVYLQPTSPLRKAVHIDKCIKTCIENEGQSCISITRSQKPPQWMYSLKEGDLLSPILQGDKEARRQDFPPSFVVNGAIYVVECEWFRKSRAFYVEGITMGYEMEPESSIDIDSSLDFSICEYLLKAR